MSTITDEELFEKFHRDTFAGITICYGCDTTFKGFNKWNLKRHLEYCKQKSGHEIERNSESSLARKTHQIKINVTTRQIVESFLRIVTVRGKPLADLNHFPDLLAPVTIFYILCYFMNKFEYVFMIFSISTHWSLMDYELHLEIFTVISKPQQMWSERRFLTS